MLRLAINKKINFIPFRFQVFNTFDFCFFSTKNSLILTNLLKSKKINWTPILVDNASPVLEINDKYTRAAETNITYTYNKIRQDTKKLRLLRAFGYFYSQHFRFGFVSSQLFKKKYFKEKNNFLKISEETYNHYKVNAVFKAHISLQIKDFLPKQIKNGFLHYLRRKEGFSERQTIKRGGQPHQFITAQKVTTLSANQADLLNFYVQKSDSFKNFFLNNAWAAFSKKKNFFITAAAGRRWDLFVRALFIKYLTLYIKKKKRPVPLETSNLIKTHFKKVTTPPASKIFFNNIMHELNSTFDKLNTKKGYKNIIKKKIKNLCFKFIVKKKKFKQSRYFGTELKDIKLCYNLWTRSESRPLRVRSDSYNKAVSVESINNFFLGVFSQKKKKARPVVTLKGNDVPRWFRCNKSFLKSWRKARNFKIPRISKFQHLLNLVKKRKEIFLKVKKKSNLFYKSRRLKIKTQKELKRLLHFNSSNNTLIKEEVIKNISKCATTGFGFYLWRRTSRRVPGKIWYPIHQKGEGLINRYKIQNRNSILSKNKKNSSGLGVLEQKVKMRWESKKWRKQAFLRLRKVV